MNDDKRVGLALKMKRVELGLKQTDLADIIGTHRSVISHIETGLPNTLGKTMIRRLASALDLSDDWAKIAKSSSSLPSRYNPQVRIPDEYTHGFPGKVQRARIEKLVSQIDLANIANVPLTTIVDLELGRGRPTIEEIISILRVLDMDIPKKLREFLSLYLVIDNDELLTRHKDLCYMYRHERRSRKISLATLADMLLMDKGNLSRIERGLFNNLQSKTMSKLTRSIELPEEWFDITYRSKIAPADNKSWVCPLCLSLWSRYRIRCTCTGD